MPTPEQLTELMNELKALQEQYDKRYSMNRKIMSVQDYARYQKLKKLFGIPKFVNVLQEA